MRTLAPHIPAFSPSQKEIAAMEAIRKQIMRGIFIFIVFFNVFLFLRFFLRLFGADPVNPFAAFIFAVSGLFLIPIFGIFPNFRDEIVAGQMAVDVSAFVAGFCYNILSFMIMIILQIASSMMRMKKQTKETVEKGKPINTRPVDETFNHSSP